MRLSSLTLGTACAISLMGFSADAVIESNSVPGAGPPAGYDMALTFAEEFDAPLSSGKWIFAYYNPRTELPTAVKRNLGGNRELQLYFDRVYLGLGIDPFKVKASVLTIEAKPLSPADQSAVLKAIDREAPSSGVDPLRNVTYSSGMISTRSSFAQRYGYFEVRAKWSSGKGLWPAIWMLPERGGWPPEIDILEAHGDKPRTAYQSVHSKSQPAITRTVAVPAPTGEFHRYGLLWRPGTLDYYIDGVKTSSIPAPTDINEPMYLIINLAVGGIWPGNPDASTAFPATMQIDYVRAWRFKSPQH
jgi:beta-glucanase (GH16 family)